jgi:L-amino acid N-acyltransferase YncA
VLSEYPKKISLSDGLMVTLRLMNRDDQHALYKFFVNLEPEDRRFLRSVVTDRKLIERWARHLNYDQVLPILAEYESHIVANATLHSQTFGWGRHVAEIRVTVSSEFQGRRLGAVLIEELSALASRRTVKKLLAKIVTTRQGVISSFEKAGFSKVTELPNYVKDLQTQQYADIALLVKELQPATP